MFEPLIRTLAFLTKEINEVRRQPGLVLSLILGPFLILLLFGIGYRSDFPVLRTTLVVPASDEPQIAVDELARLIDTNFELVEVTADREAALRQLAREELDVVQVLPGQVAEQVRAGEHATIQFYSNSIDPVDEQWIEYLSFAAVNEINKALLLRAVAASQQEAGSIRDEIAATRGQLAQAESQIDTLDRAELQATLNQLERALNLLARSPLALTQLDGLSGTDTARQELIELQADLDTLDTALERGTIAAQEARIASVRTRLTRIEDQLDQFVAVPPAVVVSPLQPEHQNLRGHSYDLVAYYVPAVFALLIQHVAVALGALSIVRERALGTFEVFRVAPINTAQMVLGKYLAYTLFVAVIAAVLIGLIHLLLVPVTGSLLYVVLAVLVLTGASLGIGFVISTLATTDSQAIQLVLLMLLLSIFFSGFFLPLENFWPAIRGVAYLLPLTHGIVIFQDLLLRGRLPEQLPLLVLTTMAFVLFIVTQVVLVLQLRRSTA